MHGAAPAKRSPTTTSRDGDLRALCERVLRANWGEGVHRDGTPYGYTCPATPR